MIFLTPVVSSQSSVKSTINLSVSAPNFGSDLSDNPQPTTDNCSHFGDVTLGLGLGATDGVAVGVTVAGAERDGDEDSEGDGEGDAPGDGLARISSHVQSSPLYPPMSLSRLEQRSCSFGKSGGPGNSSAEPGNTI